MKQKRVTVSKVVLFLPYLISLVILALVMWAVTSEKPLTTVTALSTLYTATIAIAGYTTKWYAKKAALENEPKIRLGVIEATIELARKNPDFKIYDAIQARADVQAVTNPIKADEESQYKSLVSEDVGIKV
jgi:hypothetical protein